MMGQALSTDRPASEHAPLGMGLRLLAGVALSLMFAGVKWASQHGVGVIESLFYRQLGTATCALVFALSTMGTGALRSQRVGAHIARMGIGLVAMATNFLSFSLLPLAEATAIGFSTPIFSTFLAAVLLRETTGPWRWAAVFVGFLGVLVIVQPGGGHITSVGALVGIAAAVSTAMATIAIRRLGATEAVATTVFWFGASSLVPLGLAMPFIGSNHPPMVFAVLGGMALAGGIAQLLLTGALRFAPVALVMTMDYAALLWASLLGYFVFAQMPSHFTLMGAPIVMGAGLVILWREQRRLRRTRPHVFEVPE